MIKPREAVLKMDGYSPPTSGRENKLRLDFNENTVGCSPKVLEAIKKINENKISVYPEYNNFRKKLASFLGVKKNEVLLTNATDEAIKIVMDTFIEKGDEVIIPVPTFAMYKFYASLSEANVIEILYNKDLSFPTKKIINSISEKTKLIILVNPNNPTGTVIKKRDILRIVKKAEKVGALVLVDEAYYEFYGKSFLNFINNFKNLIITRTFSKAYGLAGLRIGYIVAKSKIINFLEKASSPYGVNILAVIAAEAALEDKEFVKSYVMEVKKSKVFLKKELKKLGIKTYPSKANFLLANFGNSCEKVYKNLKKKGILVRNRTNDPLLKNCLRIGIGSKEQCKKFINALKEIKRDDVLLFDLDGVLVDVSNSYRISIKETAEFFTGKEVSMEEIQKYKEMGGYNNDWDLTEAIILSRNIKIKKEKIIEKFQEFYLGKKEKKGLIENEKWLLSKKILNRLYKNYRLGIVTGRPKKEALYVLKKNKVIKYFDVIIGMEDYPENKGKPDPFSIKLALKKLGSKSAIYFGDNIDDIKAGKSANIKVIGVIPPGISSEKLKNLMLKNGADGILQNISNIEKILKNWGRKK